MTTVSLNWSLVVTVGWRGQWQNLGNNLFLYNHGTKNDLHTFEVFQRTRIEGKDEGGAANLSLLGLSQSSLLTSVRIRGWRAGLEAHRGSGGANTKEIALVQSAIGCQVEEDAVSPPESSCEFQTLSEVCGN